MMHHMATSVIVLDCEVTDIRLLMERHAGVLVEKSPEVLGEFIADYLEVRHLNSAAELISILKDSPAECDEFLEALLPSQSGFFRYPAVFEALGRDVIPELKARKLASGTNSLRTLSAGCASGEETYSIAMTVCEVINAGSETCRVQNLGSDNRQSDVQSDK